MLHVKQIKVVVDEGRIDEAHEALDQLLALGPQNTEALKLKARLFGYEGRYAMEYRIWDLVADIDPEDDDAAQHMWNRQVEEREHFYFTDDLPGGGRRFMTYPRRPVTMALVGLVGCFGFLALTRLTSIFPFLGETGPILTLFTMMVLFPWVGIIWAYLRSIRAVILSPEGITVSSRSKVHAFLWGDLEQVCMARAVDAKSAFLSLILIPRTKEAPVVEIDMREGRTAIRARFFLIREIGRLYKEPEYSRRESLDLTKRKISFY